jgi:hypothetical protein
MEDPVAPDEEKMVDFAVAELGTRFPAVARDEIESTVRRHVEAWWTRARIKTYIGVIAGREARAELARSARQAAHTT